MNPARVRRERLDTGLEPVEVLRRLRGAERIAALIGDWHQGEALIACDPVRVAPIDDPFAAIDDTSRHGNGALSDGELLVHHRAPGTADSGTPTFPPADRT